MIKFSSVWSFPIIHFDGGMGYLQICKFLRGDQCLYTYSSLFTSAAQRIPTLSFWVFVIIESLKGLGEVLTATQADFLDLLSLRFRKET